MQCVRAHHIGRQRVDQRLQRRRGGADPAGQGRGFQGDAVAGEDLGLAIERQVIVELRHDDMRQQTGSGAAAGNRMVGRRRGNDRVAGPAGELFADVPNHLEAAWDVIEGLAYVLADAPQRAATARAGRAGAMPDLLARRNGTGTSSPNDVLRHHRCCSAALL